MGRKTSFPQEELGRMKARWEAGDDIEDIAGEFNLTSSAIRYHAKENKWESRGAFKEKYNQNTLEAKRNVVIADKVERSLQETEKFIQDSERIRMLILQFQGRMLKNRDPATNELILDKSEGDLIFQYLKCCKISMETLTIGYMGKRKALGMDDVVKNDVTVLPWED